MSQPLIRQSTVQTGAGLSGGGELSAGGRTVGGRARARMGAPHPPNAPLVDARGHASRSRAVPRRPRAVDRPNCPPPTNAPAPKHPARQLTFFPPLFFPPPLSSAEAARACNSRINGVTSSSSSTCAGERRRVPRTGPAGEDRDPAPSAKRRTTGTPILRAAPHLLTANTNFPALLLAFSMALPTPRYSPELR